MEPLGGDQTETSSGSSLMDSGFVSSSDRSSNPREVRQWLILASAGLISSDCLGNCELYAVVHPSNETATPRAVVSCDRCTNTAQRISTQQHRES
jgi:hypothetical protein